MDLRRPSLLWMKSSEVKLVRAMFLHLCLESNQYLLVKGPIATVPRVKIFTASIVSFEWEYLGDTEMPRRAYMKTESGEPKWDFEWIGQDGMKHIDQNIKFADLRCKPAALLVKHYSKHFPFVPSENYFLKGGEMIA